LSDVSDKLFNPEESLTELDHSESKKNNETQSKKKRVKKKIKGKGK
jgi:hypothetical protein